MAGNRTHFITSATQIVGYWHSRTFQIHCAVDSKTQSIALSLIRVLCENGDLDADDIAEITKTLNENDAHQVNMSFIEGTMPEIRPDLTVLEGGKADD